MSLLYLLLIFIRNQVQYSIDSTRVLHHNGMHPMCQLTLTMTRELMSELASILRSSDGDTVGDLDDSAITVPLPCAIAALINRWVSLVVVFPCAKSIAAALDLIS